MPKFTAYDGTELAYHLVGAGKPLICLPGGPAPASAHPVDLGGLGTHRQLVLLDQRGTGGPAVPDGVSSYPRDRLVDDVEALREHLGLETVDLLGHSAAGDLATLYAAAHPHRTGSLVLVASALPAEALAAVEAPVLHLPGMDAPDFARTVAAFLEPGVHSVRTASGLRLAYRTWGDASAPPVVLAHGRGGSGAHWTEVAERLAATRRVYAVDLRGHGLSDWPGQYSFEGFRDDLRGFFEALGLAGADLIGHSMGGAAALLLAQDAPELIGRLVLEEAPTFVPLDPPRGFVARPDEELAFDWPVVADTNAQLNAPDPAWRERLAELAVPTLLVAGGESSGIEIQARIAEMAARIPGARLVTIDAGHSVHAVRPDEFVAELRKFGI
ncbi:alpha/beta hydrolase [Streptomyces sp. BPTC-684]|uniref:alpha/beta fold hydrolase n=1 Tax=Streptomyces sp. BPTC-684 TaxID=3043734 RepID=UPI0024B09BA9|nr:alpha/beta hydrolase [Streptomyces sp. BPTC-684]WHM40183.1 alpha/beta hydrolase [Streptomyces sp. BPTC-684]